MGDSSRASSELGFESFRYIEDVENIEDYLWREEGQTVGQSFRVLNEIIFSDVWTEEMKPLYHDHNDNGPEFLLMMGTLIPSKSSSPSVLIKIAVPKNKWYLFVKTIANREIWVYDHEGVLYKTTSPHRIYERLYEDFFNSFVSFVNNSPFVKGTKCIDVTNYAALRKSFPVSNMNYLVSGLCDDCRLCGTVFITTKDGSKPILLHVDIGEIEIQTGNFSSPVDLLARSYGFKVSMRLLNPQPQQAREDAVCRAHLTTEKLEKVYIERAAKQYSFLYGVSNFLLEDIVSTNGEVLQSMAAYSPEVSYHARGYLIPPPGLKGEKMRCSIDVDDILVDITKTGKRTTSAFYVQCGKQLFRLKDSETGPQMPSPPIGISSRDVLSLLDEYNWPAEDGEVWRHINNFMVYTSPPGPVTVQRVAPYFTNVFDIGSTTKTYIVKGTLLPPPMKDLPPLSVFVHPKNYSIDFGVDVDDKNRGLWVTDKFDAWYKLATPQQAFEKIAEENFKRTKLFLEFHDALTQNETVMRDNIIVVDLDTLWERTGEAFDVDFVREHAEFIMTNLETLDIDFHKSKSFMASLKKPSGSTKGKSKNVLPPTSTSSKPHTSSSLRPSSEVEDNASSSSSSKNINKSSLPINCATDSDDEIPDFPDKLKSTQTSANRMSNSKTTETARGAAVRSPVDLSMDDDDDDIDLFANPTPKDASNGKISSTEATAITKASASLDDEDVKRSVSKIPKKANRRQDDDEDDNWSPRDAKKRTWEEVTAVPATTASASVDPGSLCNFCHSLKKSPKCRSTGHVDGQPHNKNLYSGLSSRTSGSSEVESHKRARVDDLNPFDRDSYNVSRPGGSVPPAQSSSTTSVPVLRVPVPAAFQFPTQQSSGSAMQHSAVTANNSSSSSSSSALCPTCNRVEKSDSCTNINHRPGQAYNSHSLQDLIMRNNNAERQHFARRHDGGANGGLVASSSGNSAMNSFSNDFVGRIVRPADHQAASAKERMRGLKPIWTTVGTAAPAKPITNSIEIRDFRPAEPLGPDAQPTRSILTSRQLTASKKRSSVQWRDTKDLKNLQPLSDVVRFEPVDVYLPDYSMPTLTSNDQTM